MKILVDLRSLQIKTQSGVGTYTSQLLEHLLPIDQTNSYLFFYNALRPQTGLFHYVNSQAIQTRIPNKLLNSSLAFFGWPKFERLVGNFDCLFLPNLHHFAVSPQKKVVITVHDLSPLITPEFYDTKRRIWHYMLSFKKKLLRANRIIAVSEFTKHELQHHLGILPEKICVIPEGVDDTKFHTNIPDSSLRDLRNRLGLPGEFILFLSTVEPRKNLLTLIESFEQLPRGTHLVIAGQLGWKYSEVMERISTSKKRSLIHVLGYVAEEDKPVLIKLARVVCYPSFYEGFGLVPLEAMAVGTPVVTSNVSSLPEVAGGASLIVDPYHAGWLANALEQALYNNQVREVLTQKGIVQASFFRWQTAAEKTLAVFENL